MRILTMATGVLFIGAGVYLMANSGITFLSVAFPIGLAFMVAGVIECISYSSYRGDNEERTWILIDGTTTFMLGALIILNKLTADAVVPAVLGLWVITTGIRNFVRAWEKIEERQHDFYDHLVTGLFNLICGLYVFFDSDIFNLQTMTMVGLCVIVQGINIVNIGATIIIQKPDYLKTKVEKLEEAAAKAAEAHEAAKVAIKAAKDAKAEVRVIEATPEEVLDITMAPKPGTEEAENIGSAVDKSAEGGTAVGNGEEIKKESEKA